MPYAWQITGPGEPLVRQEVAPLVAGRDELVLDVMHCGLCHSDVSMFDNAVGRPGAFATQVKAHQDWAIPLPAGLDPAVAGPLYCGGITVFAPLFDESVSPTARVAVIGVGGLGHIALQFCRAWGCEVTAVTSSPAKAEQARQLGAHEVVTLADLASCAGRFDLISTP